MHAKLREAKGAYPPSGLGGAHIGRYFCTQSLICFRGFIEPNYFGLHQFRLERYYGGTNMRAHILTF